MGRLFRVRHFDSIPEEENVQTQRKKQLQWHFTVKERKLYQNNTLCSFIRNGFRFGIAVVVVATAVSALHNLIRSWAREMTG